MNDATPKPRRGRPPGRRHNTKCHLRIPAALHRVLGRVAAQEGKSVATIMRFAAHRLIADLLPSEIKKSRNERLSPRTRIRATTFVREAIAAELAMGPAGVPLARAAAAEQREIVAAE